MGALTGRPHCKGKMVDWFGYMWDTKKYKMWHTEDHHIVGWDKANSVFTLMISEITMKKVEIIELIEGHGE